MLLLSLSGSGCCRHNFAQISFYAIPKDISKLIKNHLVNEVARKPIEYAIEISSGRSFSPSPVI